MRTILARLGLISCLLLFTGCSSIAYLSHTASGHLQLMSKRQSIASVLEQQSTSLQTRQALKSVQDIRKFASESLGLPDNKSYTHYVDLQRDYVTWVVFAAPELSLQPVSWCFWIVGCVPYRGYFAQEKAAKFADQLSAKGLEVYTSPVAAYSTLGWFSDPVLSSMLNRGVVATADTIFHELAHQQLYIKDDTDFNEAFATAVARAGVRDWLVSISKHELLKRYEQSLAKKDQIYDGIQTLRQQLKDVYASSESVADKRKQKELALHSYRQTTTELINKWQQADRYRAWALQDINNAKLNAISTYQDLTSDFLALLEVCNNEYSKFYKVVASTQKLEKIERRKYLRELKCKQIDGASAVP